MHAIGFQTALTVRVLRREIGMMIVASSLIGLIACGEEIRMVYHPPGELVFAGFSRTVDSSSGSSPKQVLVRVVGEERGLRDWYLRKRYADYQVIPELWLTVPSAALGKRCGVPQQCAAALIVMTAHGAPWLNQVEGWIHLSVLPDGHHVAGELHFVKSDEGGGTHYRVDLTLGKAKVHQVEWDTLASKLAERARISPSSAVADWVERLK